MSVDGGMRPIFRKYLRDAMWTSIESGSTAQGIPDSHFVFPPKDNSASGWVEMKQSEGNAVSLRTHQVAWISQYIRYGGRAFIAIRKRREQSARIAACDELHLYHGRDVKTLFLYGLSGCKSLVSCGRGPARWDWGKVKAALTN